MTRARRKMQDTDRNMKTLPRYSKDFSAELDLAMVVLGHGLLRSLPQH